MQKLFGVTRLKPFITFEEENIYLFFHDSPYLIKSVRNNIKNTIFLVIKTNILGNI